MTNSPYWAYVGCVGLLISTMSACAASPGVPSPGSLRIQAQQYLHRTAETQTTDDSQDAQDSAENAALYAKGFKDGCTDSLRAQQANQEREQYLTLHAKYGDRYETPGADTTVGGQQASASEQAATPAACVTCTSDPND